LIAHGDAAGGADRLVPLGVDELLDTACNESGLDDFGDGPWRESFELLIDNLNGESKLHLLGRMITRTELLQSLRARLQLTELWKQQPDILKGDVTKPVFIVGSPRSGTSILHELMACDSKTRVPLFWEMQFPDDAVRGRSRAETSDHVTQFWHDVQPEYETMQGGYALRSKLRAPPNRERSSVRVRVSSAISADSTVRRRLDPLASQSAEPSLSIAGTAGRIPRRPHRAHASRSTKDTGVSY
jgi:hypothetical protein